MLGHHRTKFDLFLIHALRYFSLILKFLKYGEYELFQCKNTNVNDFMAFSDIMMLVLLVHL